DVSFNTNQKKRKTKNNHEQLPQVVEPVSEDRRRELNRALIKAFICCGIPWVVIDNPCFINLLKLLEPGYTPPHRDILANREEEAINLIESQLQENEKLKIEELIDLNNSIFMEDNIENISNNRYIEVSTQSQSVYRTATIPEPQENGLVYPVNLVTYPNDTIVIRLFRNLTCPISSNIMTPLRFISPTLVLTITNLNYAFDPVNYCPTNQTNTTLSNLMNIFAIPDNFLLIRYWIVPSSSPNMVQYYGLIVSSNGTITNRDTPVQLSNPINITNATASNTQIATLDNNKKGIIFVSNDFKSFATIDGGYQLVYSVSLKNQELILPNSSTLSPTTLIVFSTVLRSDSSNFTPPVIIYQSLISEATISISNCQSNSENRPGYLCILHGQSTPQSLTPGVSFWEMLSFISTGTDVSSVDLPKNYVNGNDVITYSSAYLLHNGGVLMLGQNQNGTLQGSIFNDNGAFVQDWGLPLSQGMIASYTEGSNTVWAVAPSINNSWSVYSIGLPSFLPSDVLLMNPSIQSINPTVNSSISKNTSFITITFRQDVAPSVANITIYYHTNDSDNLRQTLSANSSEVHFINRRQIVIDVLPSTFNQEGANYFITIDPNFVALRESGEPLPGVSNGTWSFFTERTTSTFTDDETIYFENLSEENKTSFYDELITSFANALSVNVSRLSIQRRFQHDASANEPWPILFRMTLVAATQIDEINTQDMLESLASLVTNKSITSLMLYNSTASLDSNYGLIRLTSIWERYRFEIVGVIFIIFVLFVLIFLSNRAHPEEFYGNDNFHQWAKQNVFVSSIFIVLSYCDIESLDFVSSDIANISWVQAPFSKGVYEALYISTFIVMFIEDIPQFIILVIYLQRVVITRFVPLITVFTCALIIVTNIVSHVYDCINMIWDSKNADTSKKTYKKWWEVGKASASRRISSRKHPHFLSGFVPIQPDPATQVVSPVSSIGVESSV
ncbi:2388_t:CDS:10, partial [Dentiscutata erythropus]